MQRCVWSPDSRVLRICSAQWQNWETYKYCTVEIKNCCSPADSSPCQIKFRVRRVINLSLSSAAQHIDSTCCTVFMSPLAHAIALSLQYYLRVVPRLAKYSTTRALARFLIVQIRNFSVRKIEPSLRWSEDAIAEDPLKSRGARELVEYNAKAKTPAEQKGCRSPNSRRLKDAPPERTDCSQTRNRQRTPQAGRASAARVDV